MSTDNFNVKTFFRTQKVFLFTETKKFSFEQHIRQRLEKLRQFNVVQLHQDNKCQRIRQAAKQQRNQRVHRKKQSGKIDDLKIDKIRIQTRENADICFALFELKESDLKGANLILFMYDSFAGGCTKEGIKVSCLVLALIQVDQNEQAPVLIVI